MPRKLWQSRSRVYRVVRGILPGDGPGNLGGTLVFTTNEPTTGYAPVAFTRSLPPDWRHELRDHLRQRHAQRNPGHGHRHSPACHEGLRQRRSRVYRVVRGILAGDGPGNLGGTLQFTTNEPASGYAPVGSYLITPSGLTSSTYIVTFVPGTLSVTPAPLAVTANPATKTYGSADPAFTVSYLGFVPNEGPGNLSGTLHFVTNEPGSGNAAVGSYQVTPSGLTSNNYAITFFNGALSVTPAALTVTANYATKAYGSPDPAFTASYVGLATGDTPASLGGTLLFATNEPASGYAPVGFYQVTPSGLTSTNYTVTFAGGTLDVVPATLTVTANGVTKTYAARGPDLHGVVCGLRVG